MKVMIDFSQISVRKAGVGVYAYNLLKNFGPHADIHFYVIVQDDDDCLDDFDENFFTLIKIRSKLFRFLPFRFLLEQIYFPYLVLKHKVQVIHSLHYSFPLFTSAKKIVTVHDMIFFKIPNVHEKIKVFYFRAFTYLAAKLSNHVICVTKSTQNDFLEIFPFAALRTSVVHLGKDEMFNPNVEERAIIYVKNKYKIKNDYILFIGTLEPRKNIERLVEAFSKLIKDKLSLSLVIVGAKGWHYDSIFSLVRTMDLEDHVIFTGFVPEVDKPALISGSKIFAYPSMYEGFGIPILEAMACGTPVVTSNTPALKEVSNGATLLIDPYDVDDIYEAIKKIYFDISLQVVLREKGLAQAQQYDWRLTSKKTIDIYQSELT